MSKILIPLISIVLFQGILFVVSGVSAVFKDINEGFTLFIDTASKGATIAVFIWAVFLFIEQRKDKQQDLSLQRLKELSFRLIDFIGSSSFSLNKNSANILITYISTLKSEAESKHSTSAHLKESKLAIDIVYESLKATNLVDIVGVESATSYSETLDTLTKYYSDISKLAEIDNNLAKRIESGDLTNTNYAIGVPSQGVQLWQIKQIMSYLLEVDEGIIESELKRQPNSIMDRHHHFPTLYAFYHFYTKGLLHVSKEQSFSFSLGGLLMACER
ncbi:hypothetical protein KCN56_08790 [Photobacterium galatheae]|uniref:hypothetical protein n=1 Tax=Photobacterium galatheae TaxID=1654360 RepID=UPI00202CCC52|nr:hypothetical protein [Photobacterium galatheae]MCM0148653.1 hypothetical protein [Photobacterium galatheae]